jgi:hypothetical protein
MESILLNRISTAQKIRKIIEKMGLNEMKKLLYSDRNN